MLSRRHVVMGGAMLAASAVALARRPVQGAQPLRKRAIDKIVPNQVGRWRFESASGLVLPPPDALSDRLYDEIVTRVYVAAGAPPIMLLIAYSDTQDGMLQVHRPETCYPVGGFQLSPIREISVAVGLDRPVGARFFTAEGSSRTEQVLYWTRIGDRMPVRWLDQRIAVMEANLKGSIPDGLLVRMSAVTTDADEAMPVLREFAEALAAGLAPPERRFIFGGA